jgi:hypothetical protein
MRSFELLFWQVFCWYVVSVMVGSFLILISGIFS